MTLREIVTLVATKRGLAADNTYVATLLDLAKQRARQVWESHDWPERLATGSISVGVGAQGAVIAVQYYHSLISVQNATTKEMLEPKSLTDFHRARPTFESNPAQGFPYAYAIQRIGTVDTWNMVFDTATTEAWTAQLLYRLTRQSMFEARDDDDGDLLLNGAETVLEFHVEADSLEMDDERWLAMKMRDRADAALAALKLRTARSPAHQRVLPAFSFTADD